MILINMPLKHLRELKKVVALLTFEHLKTQKLVVSKHYFLVCPYLRLFSHIYICVFILERHYFGKLRNIIILKFCFMFVIYISRLL